jgi:hypothetical protein
MSSSHGTHARDFFALPVNNHPETKNRQSKRRRAATPQPSLFSRGGIYFMRRWKPDPHQQLSPTDRKRIALASTGANGGKARFPFGMLVSRADPRFDRQVRSGAFASI